MLTTIYLEKTRDQMKNQQFKIRYVKSLVFDNTDTRINVIFNSCCRYNEIPISDINSATYGN